MNFKPFLMQVFLCFTLLTLFSNPTFSETPVAFVPLPIFNHPLTAEGENNQARYSPDGKYILFVSRHRTLHDQAQVYVKSLDDQSERRVTFHDGVDKTPAWQDNDKILFASSTDEQKEVDQILSQLERKYKPSNSPTALNPSSAPLDVSGFEVYAQSLDGRLITQLTDHPGVDTEPDYDRLHRRVIFSSDRDGKTQLFSTLELAADTKSRRPAPLRLTKSDGSDRQPRVSPDGESLAWIRNGHLEWARFNALNSPTTMAVNSDRDPAWVMATGEIIWSSNRFGAHYDLYLVDPMGICIRRLTNANVDLFQPDVSPDGKHLLFAASAKAGALEQIYQIDFNPPATCWDTLVSYPKNSGTQ